MGSVARRRVVTVLGLVVAVFVGFAAVVVGWYYAASIDDTPPPAADRRLGTILVLAGSLLAAGPPIALALRTRKARYWVVAALVLAVLGYEVHDWPPKLDWTF